MADNTVLSQNTNTGDTVRDKDRAGVKTTIVGLDLTIGGGSETLMNGSLPVTQSGSWSITANAGTGTFAISASSLPLPTGASTAAKQPALGIAGTASADVLSVQGIASMTPLAVSQATAANLNATVVGTGTFAVQATQAGGWTVTAAQTTAANLNATVVGTGTFAVQAAQTGTWSVRAQDGSGTGLTSLALGSQHALTIAVVDASGNQITSFGGSGGTASNFTSAFPASGTAAGFSDGTNMQGAHVFDLDSGAGTQYCLGMGIRLSASGGSVEGGTSSNPLRIDPTGTTTQPISGTITANAGTGTYTISGTVTANAGTNLNTSALALDTSVSGILVAQGSTTSGEKGPLIQGAVTTSAPSYTTAQTSPLSLDTGGNLRTLATQSGTWNIGTVTTLTGITNNVTVVGTGTFAVQSTLQAGTALIGQVSASHETATIYSGTTALTPKFAVISASSSGATTIVAAVTSKRIRVLRWSLSSNGDVNVKWQSHVTPTDLTGLHYLTQFASAGGSYCPVGIFQTVSGEALDINLSASVSVGGEITYVEV